MNNVFLGDYKCMMEECSRLDDASMFEFSVNTSGKCVEVFLRFAVGMNKGNKNEIFNIKCCDVEKFLFDDDDFNSFMLMSGYPDSLFIRCEDDLHALYFLPNANYPSNAEPVQTYVMRITCKELYWSAS